MPARLNPKQDQRCRDAIKTTQLLKRLQLFALDEAGPQDEVVELSANRLRAIDTLLRKVLPDLSATTIDATVTSAGMTDEELDERIAVLQREVGAIRATH